jgi:hypothetical protein
MSNHCERGQSLVLCGLWVTLVAESVSQKGHSAATECNDKLVLSAICSKPTGLRAQIAKDTQWPIRLSVQEDLVLGVVSDL